MTQTEYEHKRRECWEEFWKDGNLTPHNINQAFNYAFDHAYALGKQEKDADTEEMLTVPRSKVQEQYSGITDEIEELDKNGLYYQTALLRNSTNVLDALFGSKCMPDEEPLFSNQPENYNNENLIVASENKPTESTCTDDCPSPCPSQHFDNIINQSFADHNRLHIAAMLAAGMLASEVRCYPVDRALELADKLIAECEKGDNNA